MIDGFARKNDLFTHFDEQKRALIVAFHEVGKFEQRDILFLKILQNAFINHLKVFSTRSRDLGVL